VYFGKKKTFRNFRKVDCAFVCTNVHCTHRRENGKVPELEGEKNSFFLLMMAEEEGVDG
jgi:hypothetical protein